MPLLLSVTLLLALMIQASSVCAEGGAGARHYAELAGRIADGVGLDRDLVQALIAAESGYDPQAVSPVGAIGLMQVMPETARDYGVVEHATLVDPETNLRTGMRHLKRLLEKYDNIARAVMAYNAGEGAVARGGGWVDYPETQRYTHRVLTDYLGRKGVAPYSETARTLVGIELTPAMARAGGEGRSGRGALRPVLTRTALRSEMVARRIAADAVLAARRRDAQRVATPSLKRAPPGYLRAPPVAR
ncbi:lytic transglycosylase domain-containing protein [Marichromatium bheemlicum]|uniref:Lytic transglycosylase domain-containing protein n=1 Tax=Marichromatium bheemlicum TaxID=365339 RepID=A0ABX1IBS9_9GAMM|nr:lytic transglycosylase domain-containing protein [Marichromatium bheemlicum]NKN34636.1 lytic transglycosylase domain-containing protein [Marichromatium bheemlicum]